MSERWTDLRRNAGLIWLGIFSCPRCAGYSPKLSQEDFISKAVSVHGNRYTYGKVQYISSHKKVIITCPTHGDYKQTPGSHFRGSGCPRCGGTRKRTQEEFILKAKSIHGNRYSYSNTIYLTNNKKVSITCPQHGDFLQSPTHHLAGKGCPKCATFKRADKLRLPLEDFIKKAKQIHGPKYCYDKVNYRDKRTKVIITCPSHGDFAQTPDSHVSGKSGCPQCGGYARLTLADFISKAKSVHGDKYSYEKTVFNTVHHLVTITCPFHGDFEQLAHKHLEGHGCRRCRMPRGERDIELFLKENNINYEYQYSPEGLRSKQKLFYDFSIKINEHMGLIEYHGAQHYKPISFGGGVSDHAGNLTRDGIKERYAITNKIPLLVISYKDHNRIPALLENFIEQMKKPG